MFDGVVEHFPHVVECAFCRPSLRGRKQSVINQPKLIGAGIDINTGDNPDAFDDGVSIARILPPHRFDRMRIIFVSHRVVKQQITVFRENNRILDLLPNRTRFKPVVAQIAV